MKLIMMALCWMVGFSLSVHAETKVEVKVDVTSLASMMDSFDSYSNLLDGFEKMGYLTKDEHAALSNFLEAQNISQSSKPLATIVSGNKLAWGELSLTVISPNEYRTNSGNIIRLSPADKAEKRIARIAKAFAATKSTKAEFFMNSAHAATNAASGSATVKTLILDKVEIGVQFGAAALCAVNVYPTGWILNGVGILTRQFVTKGAVTCDGNQYKVAGLEAKDMPHYGSKLYEDCANTTNLSGSKRDSESLVVKMCAFCAGAAQYLRESLHTAMNKTLLTDEWLSARGLPTTCTKNSARIAEEKLHADGNKLFSTEFGSNPSSPLSANTATGSSAPNANLPRGNSLKPNSPTGTGGPGER
jgi:hypothetical protein